MRRVNKLVKSIAMLCTMLLAGAAVYGCTAPLAVQGISGVSPVAFSYMGQGKYESSWLVRYEDARLATLRAGRKLGMVVKKEEIGKAHALYRFEDSLENPLIIKIERRTETLTWIRFDVGFFGEKSVGRLMARQIKIEIMDMGAFLERDLSVDEAAADSNVD